MGPLKQLAKETLWYGLSSILGRVFAFFLTPLYTSSYVFSPGEYGIVTDLYAQAAFFAVIYLYGLETAYFRFSTKNKSQDNFNIIVSSLIVTSVVFSGLLMLFSKEIADMLGYPGHEMVIQWLAIILAVDAILAVPFAKLRLQNKAVRFASIKLVNILLVVSLNLFFLIFCKMVYEGQLMPSAYAFVASFYDPSFTVKYVFLANLLANATLIIFLFKEFRGFRFVVDFKALAPVLIYALPLLIMGLAGVTNEMLSRAMLKNWLPEGYYPGQTNLHALGVFGACYKLSVFMQLGIQAFRYAAEPFFFANAKNKESPLLFRKVLQGFVAFNSIIFVVICLNLDFLGVLFLRNPEYHEALFVVPFLLMAYLFQGIYYNLSVWFKVTDKTIWGAIITTIGALITAVLNYLLIPIFGYFGCAIATLVTFVAMAMISYLIGQRHYPIPYNLGRILTYIGSAGVWVWILYGVNFDNLLADLILKNLLVFAYLLFIYLLERKNIRGVKILGIRLP